MTVNIKNGIYTVERHTITSFIGGVVWLLVTGHRGRQLGEVVTSLLGTGSLGNHLGRVRSGKQEAGAAASLM